MKIGPNLRVRRERGATLLIALVFLVIMAMLGVTVANVTTLEERMAGHTRDRDLALQSAEAALRDAELRLDDAGFRGAEAAFDFDTANANDAAYWDGVFGTVDDDPCAACYNPLEALPEEDAAGAVAQQPEYIIERKPDVGSTEIYRVTARGVGGTPDAIVILQAEFGFTP
jgi:type IV pilus assembly protein PilX